ncbi:Protein N-acetyltransferase, RimJ/RimL family [Halogranum rubrum]|uniref:Protein N-acetyltransferase, RimJ/RimL family n=1 Tax=Halogranum rubrum TaxID=553466 RepID=A0A1I4IZJ6_9EURY|nr:GNAT family protein [Halogranum rubrum]SFL59291.1 Protein N-acetyltransferase, RimJ/RimL family [Halogranum rubrum]
MPGSTFLYGERLTLRTVERDDAEFLQRWQSDPRVRIPLGMMHPQNRKQVEEGMEKYVESDDGINLLVCVDDWEETDGADGDDAKADEPAPIGMVSVMHLDHTRPELAYWLVPDARGDGYATEAMELLLDYTFDTFEIQGLWAQAFAYNEGSWGLLERLGFEHEGTMRNHRFVRGEYVDVVCYGLLREEWSDRE